MFKPVHKVVQYDLELWKMFREGDQNAYTTLMHKFSKRLFSYGIRFNADRDFVKDCIQDVFFELWNRRNKINQTACVSSYLLKALRLRIFREQSKWRTNEELKDEYEFLVEFNIESRLIHDQATKELSCKIQNMLNDFPERQKEIVYLRFYENLDHDRIAQIMGLSRQSVYNLLQKALNRFRREWAIVAMFLLSGVGIYYHL